jgi:hypothetical protein
MARAAAPAPASAAPRRPALTGVLLRVLAILMGGVVTAAGWTLASPTTLPYAPLHLSGGLFFLIVLAASAVVALVMGQPRAAFGSVPVLSAVTAVLYGLVLALPALVDPTLNAVGLVNYAITQGAFAFFIILPLAFFGACVGLIAGYIWQDRTT